MKPNDVYQAAFLSEATDLWSISYFLETTVDLSDEVFDTQDQVTVRTHFNPYIDGTRHASLYSVWFRKQPVMICKGGGRPDYEHYAKYITNLDQYYEMIKYLKTLAGTKEPETQDLYAPDEEIDDLNIVYTFEVAPTDFGAIPHARTWFRRFLTEWFSAWAWPYDVQTLHDKQKVRWPRIQQEAQRLLRVDPSTAAIAKLTAETLTGSDDVIRQLLILLDGPNHANFCSFPDHICSPHCGR